ncbi:MAG: hypothetical protein R3319_03445 [Candidatus Bathyarchaeia archaeon]|nr:hypothetical protein [Candidatus Bathyarchaeia archaeon]
MPFKTSTPQESIFWGILRGNWLFLLLLGLPLVSFVSPHVSLLTGFGFTFFVPGLIFYRFFRLKSLEILVFVPVFSVLVSTQLVYYLSLAFGYSREIILVSFLVLAFVYGIVNSRRKAAYSLRDFLDFRRYSKTVLLILLVIFALSLVVLYRSVWFENTSGIVITGSNWQDTPLHYEIIESVNNGNFPPQMPHYSGESMNYHYFVDFHTAILEKLYGFLPQLLFFLNAVFILVFALAVYALAREYGKRAAIFATIIAILGWGFSFLGLFSALASGQFSPTQNYMYQYGEFFGLPPMLDNLLQQRPLLLGLPVFALVLVLLRDMKDKNRVLLAGVVTGLLFPFHSIAFLCAYVAYVISLLLNSRTFKRHYLYFLVSAVIALPFLVSSSSSVSIVIAPVWALNFLKDNPVLFYVANLGIPILAALATFVFPKKVKGAFLKLVFLILFLIPNFVSLTPNAWDMYKFFIFAWVPIAVLAGAALARIRKTVAMVLLLLSVLTTAAVISYNVGTSYQAASWDEYNLGMWVRNNTEERAVFLTYYSIHCPPAMIGGRLRVASYVNWAYGHGVSYDDIQKRFADIDRAYTGSEEDLKQVVNAYNVTYIYIGGEELSHYPGCDERFKAMEWLKPVYDEASLWVYRVS